MDFAGFELNKTHTLKVRILNVSPSPQRIHVLPPSTKYFKIRYHKKGMVPPGVSEDIYISFTPSDNRFYEDSLRINCLGDSIRVPLHAFPVIHKTKRNQVLPLMDLGRHSLGSTHEQSLVIDSDCNLDFEYKVEFLKDHPEITMVSESQGTIKAN